MANFSIWWKAVPGHEGSYQDWLRQAANTADRGGATNWGVTYRTYQATAAAVGLNPSFDAFVSMTPAGAQLIAKKFFWDAVGGDIIQSQGVANMLADFGWGSGPGNAARAIQTVLNAMGKQLSVDGAIGPKTLAAINSVNPTVLLDRLTAYRRQFIENIVANDPTQRVFYNGWMNRINDVYAVARQYVADNPATITALAVGGFFLRICTI